MREAKAKQNNWNLPNALTTLRIVMVPFFGWALLVDDGGSVLWRTVAWVLFVVAMITDKVDGDIARSRNRSRRFCEGGCGNRENVRAYRDRQRGETE